MVREQLVATRVVAVETLLSTAISERDDAENARVADQVSIIDGGANTLLAARAAALCDREMPAVRPHLRRCRTRRAGCAQQQACSQLLESLL